MSPDDIISIGPLALALDRLVAVGLIALFVSSADPLVRRFQPDVPAFTGITVLAGVIGARGGYVWMHRDSFALDPLAAFQVWLGGWSWLGGILTAALVLALRTRDRRATAAGLACLAACAFLWWGFSRTTDTRPPTSLPAILAITGADGRQKTLAAYRGQPLVVNLWATWCPPCRRELPMLVDAARTERRAAILLVNQGESPAHVRAFLAQNSLRASNIAYDPSTDLGRITGSRALPTTLFVDATGRIRATHFGELSRVQLDIAIRQLIAPQSDD